MLDHSHPLYQLASQVDWDRLTARFGPLYCAGNGRPALPTRLMVGLHYLKSLYNVSDENVVERFLENPYWQYFCGFEHFQHKLPCDPTSLVKWRHRIGPEGMEELLKGTVGAAVQSKAMKPCEAEQVNVDTTVQPKAIAFPTDARLLHKSLRSLVRGAKACGLELRQSYERLGHQALVQQSRYAHARQMKRARRETKRLRTYLGRVQRDIERKMTQRAALLEQRSPAQQRAWERLEQLLALTGRIHAQQRHDRDKVYSVHAPEVVCISKGKAHRRYEFGCKVSVVTTSRKGFVIGMDAESSNVYDGATLKPALEQAQRISGRRALRACVDKGYRGASHHPPDVEVLVSGRRGLSPHLKRLLKRRQAIEPVIGHLKAEHGLERNHLLGHDGDRINAMLCACGWNLRKILRKFIAALWRLLLVSNFPGWMLAICPLLPPAVYCRLNLATSPVR